MSVKLTNISGGQIVCDLKGEKKTLRLDNKKSTTMEWRKLLLQRPLPREVQVKKRRNRKWQAIKHPEYMCKM